MESGRPGWESWLQASCLPCLSKGASILFLRGAAGLGGSCTGDRQGHERAHEQRCKPARSSLNQRFAAQGTSCSPGILFKSSLCPGSNLQTREVAQARRKRRDFANLLCVTFGDFVNPSLSVSSFICERGMRRTPTLQMLAPLTPTAASRGKRSGMRSPPGPRGCACRGCVGSRETGSVVTWGTRARPNQAVSNVLRYTLRCGPPWDIRQFPRAICPSLT